MTQLQLLQNFHYILVQLLDSDVLQTGFGYSTANLIAMKAAVEEMIAAEEKYMDSIHPIKEGAYVNTVEMARMGYRGRVLRERMGRYGQRDIFVEFRSPDNSFATWLIPDNEGRYWWGGYHLYMTWRCEMIFRQIDEIISGQKTQTRRIKKEKELYLPDLQAVAITNVYGYRAIDSCGQASYFNGHTDRLKWVVGCDYAVQPKRGRPGVWWLDCSIPKWELPGTTREAVGTPYTVGNEFSKRMGWQPLRIRITSIRQERLQDISEEDALAEGCEAFSDHVAMPGDGPNGWLTMSARDAYAERWDTINTRAGDRWANNPEVWVISFELVK